VPVRAGWIVPGSYASACPYRLDSSGFYTSACPCRLDRAGFQYVHASRGGQFWGSMQVHVRADWIELGFYTSACPLSLYRAGGLYDCRYKPTGLRLLTADIVSAYNTSNGMRLNREYLWLLKMQGVL
jgi:hypothetical protein